MVEAELPPTSTRTDHWARRAVVGFAVAVLALFVAVAGLRLVDEYRDTLHDTETLLTRVTDALAQDLRATLLDTELLLRLLRTQIETDGVLDPVDDPAVTALIETYRSRTSNAIDVLRVDQRGYARIIGAPTPANRPFYVGDRDYVRHAGDVGGIGLYIGQPVISRIEGKGQRWSVSLPLHGHQPWMGVLAVGVSADRILGPVAATHRRLAAAVAFYRLDGTLLAAAPADPGRAVGEHSGPMAQLLQQLAADGPAGFRRLEQWRGQPGPVWVSYRVLAPYPVAVLIARPAAELTQHMIDESSRLGLALGVIALITLGGAWWIVRLMRSLHQANAGLEQQVSERTRALTGEIEERKATEQQLRLFSAAVDAVDSAVFLAAPDGTVHYANPALSRLVGYGHDEIVGHHRTLWRSPEHADEGERQLLRQLAAGQPWRGEIRHRTKDGRDLWTIATASPVRDEQGRVQTVIVVQEDITSRKHDEEALRRAKSAAEQANQAKSEFLSAMSHELRTPMNAILGYAQLLLASRREPLSVQQQQFVERIAHAGQHLLELIEEVLDLARIESGRLRLSLEPVPLRAVIDDSLALVENAAIEHQVTLIDRTPEQTLPLVWADFTRLRQSVLNLLSNAVKYNRAGGHVTISVEPAAPGHLRLLVQDSGEGIPAARQGELFQPFNRLGREMSSIEGTGIGLVVTQRLLAAMNGTIGFASTEGRGSTFWLELPLTATGASPPSPAAQPRPQSAAASAAARSELPALRLLYVEDNPTNRMLLEAIVAEYTACRLTTAGSAEEALALLAHQHPDLILPDLILVDINLPGMDGIALAGRLRQDPATAGIPLVALSADAMGRTIDRALKAGFADYLVKPIRVDRLLALLTQVGATIAAAAPRDGATATAAPLPSR